MWKCQKMGVPHFLSKSLDQFSIETYGLGDQPS